MKLEQIVPSLGLCKKMWKLGIFDSSLYGWFFDDTGVSRKWNLLQIEGGGFPAPTVSEMGEKLPWDITGKDMLCLLKIAKRDNKFYYSYFNDAHFNTLKINNREAITGWNTEANCRAKMLIYLKENKLI